MRRFCVAVMLAMVWAVLLCASGWAQAKGEDEAEVCGHVVQGYIRVKDGAFLRRAVVEEILAPHDTLMFRTTTNAYGRFAMPFARRKSGSHILLRISHSAIATSIVKLRIDPTCGDPVIALPVTAGAPTGGAQ